MVTAGEADRVRPPTTADIAARAGVSRSVASRALRGDGYVGEGARVRVLEAAQALGYVPDEAARGLKARVSRCVGVLCRDVRDPWVAGVLAGVCETARDRGLVTMVAEAPDGDAAADAVRDLAAFRVAGVVVVGPVVEPVAPGVLETLAEMGPVQVDPLDPLAPLDPLDADEPDDRVLLHGRRARTPVRLGRTAAASVADRLPGRRGARSGAAVGRPDAAAARPPGTRDAK